MANDITPIDPKRFGLASFADILPRRQPIPGEDPATLEAVREGMFVTLAPMTPHECLLAENLVEIEWDRVQHTRMRQVHLRQGIAGVIVEAVVERRREEHETGPGLSLERLTHRKRGPFERRDPDVFDEAAAEAEGKDLARRALSEDPKLRDPALEELRALGLAPEELMAAGYGKASHAIRHHDEACQDLERRRRFLRRDYDLLQWGRPLEGEASEP